MNRHFIRSDVTQLDRGTFLVASQTTPGKQYHVDTTSYRGAGRCDCKDYRCRREAGNAAIGQDEKAKPSRCIHLAAVRSYMADLVTIGFMQADENKQT